MRIVDIDLENISGHGGTEVRSEPEQHPVARAATAAAACLPTRGPPQLLPAHSRRRSPGRRREPPAAARTHDASSSRRCCPPRRHYCSFGNEGSVSGKPAGKATTVNGESGREREQR